MVTQIQNLLGVVGADFSAPTNLAEFFPWFFQCLLAFCVVAGILQLIRWSVMAVCRGGRNL